MAETTDETKPVIDIEEELGGSHKSPTDAAAEPVEIEEKEEDKTAAEGDKEKVEAKTEETEKKETKEDKAPAEKKDETPQRDIRAERAKLRTKLQDLRNQLASKDALDSLDDGKLLKQISDTVLEDALLQHEAHDMIDKEVVDKQREQEEANKYWDQWSTDHPDIDLAEAQDVWDEAVLAASKKYKTREGIQAVANEKFEAGIEAVRARLAKEKAEAEAEAGEQEEKPKNPPARVLPGKGKLAQTAPVSSGGARVVPAAATAGRPVQRELTIREQIERGMVDMSPFRSVLND